MLLRALLQVQEKLPTFKCQSVANLMYALALVDARPSQRFLETVAEHVQQRMWSFSGSALSACLYGLVTCGYQVGRRPTGTVLSSAACACMFHAADCGNTCSMAHDCVTPRSCWVVCWGSCVSAPRGRPGPGPCSHAGASGAPAMQQLLARMSVLCTLCIQNKQHTRGCHAHPVHHI